MTGSLISGGLPFINTGF